MESGHPNDAEAVIENMSVDVKKNDREVVELHYDYQKAYDNVNRGFSNSPG